MRWITGGFLGVLHIPEGKNLKSPTIGQYRKLYVHKLMKSTKMSYGIISRSEIEMVGVREHDLAPDLHNMILMNPLDTRLSPNRHKNRSLDISMGSRKCSSPGQSISRGYRKIKHKKMQFLKIIRTALYEKVYFSEKKIIS